MSIFDPNSQFNSDRSKKISKQAPNSQQSTYITFKSETLNPQSTFPLTLMEMGEVSTNKIKMHSRQSGNARHGKLRKQPKDDFKMFVLTASRAKKRIQESMHPSTATTKRRISLSSQSQRIKTKTRLKSNEKSYDTICFPETLTPIPTMVQNRHRIQENTLKLTNFHNFLLQKFHSVSKRKHFESFKQNKINQTIKLNKSQKLFFKNAINENSQNVYGKNKKMRSLVIEQRRNLQQNLKNTRLQKSVAGIIRRKQMEQNEKSIQLMKQQEQIRKKQAYHRGKSNEEIQEMHRLQRQKQKKKLAEDNYRRKWMRQFLQKQRVERQNLIRTKRLSKKIQYLLQKNQQMGGI